MAAPVGEVGGEPYNLAAIAGLTAGLVGFVAEGPRADLDIGVRIAALRAAADVLQQAFVIRATAEAFFRKLQET